MTPSAAASSSSLTGLIPVPRRAQPKSGRNPCSHVNATPTPTPKLNTWTHRRSLTGPWRLAGRCCRSGTGTICSLNTTRAVASQRRVPKHAKTPEDRVLSAPVVRRHVRIRSVRQPGVLVGGPYPLWPVLAPAILRLSLPVRPGSALHLGGTCRVPNAGPCPEPGTTLRPARPSLPGVVGSPGASVGRPLLRSVPLWVPIDHAGRGIAVQHGAKAAASSSGWGRRVGMPLSRNRTVGSRFHAAAPIGLIWKPSAVARRLRAAILRSRCCS